MTRRPNARRRTGSWSPAATPVVVQVAGPHAEDLVGFVEDKVRTALGHSRDPVLHARVRIDRHYDPAVEQPVTARASVDVNGRLVRVRVRARTDREAVDLLRDRLRHRLERDRARRAGHWEDRRGRVAAPIDHQAGEAHQWRHGDAPTGPTDTG
jgi:hypothetical protein